MILGRDKREINAKQVIYMVGGRLKRCLLANSQGLLYTLTQLSIYNRQK